MQKTNDGFELSLKNKVVVMWLAIIGPTVILQVFMELFTELPRVLIAGFPAIPLAIFFTWHYFYKRKLKVKEDGGL